jgi:hypothetical protein
MSDTLPHGDSLKPERDLQGEVDPRPSELESRLDEIEQQSLAEAGSGIDNPPPRPVEDVPQGPGRAALPGEDEGPLGEGGQLRGPDAGGGGGF